MIGGVAVMLKQTSTLAGWSVSIDAQTHGQTVAGVDNSGPLPSGIVRR